MSDAALCRAVRGGGGECGTPLCAGLCEGRMSVGRRAVPGCLREGECRTPLCAGLSEGECGTPLCAGLSEGRVSVGRRSVPGCLRGG